jgi:hypothetical protein
MSCKGEHVRKPPSYRQAALEECVCLLLFCLPYYRALLFAGISGMMSVLLLTCLLLFVVWGSPGIYRTITGRLKALPLSWVAPVLDCADFFACVSSQTVGKEPSLAPSFQRPPPIFS